MWGLLFFNLLSASDINLPSQLSSANITRYRTFIDTTSEWIDFKTRYAFKNAYLVFAGPYPTSPSSSFGHLFLLLEPSNYSNKSILLWNSINFSAEIEGVNPIAKFYKGIFGGLVGTYQMAPFYEKIREYTFIESRPLWIFPLYLSSSELELLLYYLYKVQGLKYSYRFHDTNCASQIELLLIKCINKDQSSNRLVTSPRTVLINISDRFGKPYYIDSTENLLKKHKVNKLLNSKFKQLNNEKYIVKESEAAVLLTILEWKYYRRNTLLTKNEKQQLEELRILVSKSNNTNDIGLLNLDKEFNIHSSIKYGIGVQFNNWKISEYLFQFRLGLHEFSDNNDVFPKFDFISLAKANITIRDKQVFINELWLFDQQSTTPQNLLSSYMSWRLGFGTEKRMELIGKPLATGFYLGLGRTVSYFQEQVTQTLLLNFNPVYLENFGYSILLTPEFISTIYFSKYLKMRTVLGSTQNSLKKTTLNSYIKSNIYYDINTNNQLNINLNVSKKEIFINLYIFRYLN